jgi:hypothetical protein
MEAPIIDLPTTLFEVNNDMANLPSNSTIQRKQQSIKTLVTNMSTNQNYGLKTLTG